MKKVKSYKNVKKIKKKKNNNSLKKIRVKILTEQWTIYIKDVIKVYIKRIEKDLRLKVFKHHLYVEHYIIVLEFVRFIGTNKTVNIIFSKELRIIKRYLIVKDQKRI